MKSDKIRKITVPYDGSIHSKHTFNMELSLAQKYKSKLVLITCIEKINGCFGNADGIFDSDMEM